MSRARSLPFLLGVLLVVPVCAQPVRIPATEWSEREVGVGVRLRTAHPQDLFGGKLHLSALLVEPRTPGVRLAFSAGGGFARTSKRARDAGALAACNGGFFDGKARNVGICRAEGVDSGGVNETFSHALALGKGGKVARIVHDPSARFAGLENVLTGRPRLLLRGEIAPELPAKGPRHPRTAVGTTARGEVLVLVVDGRNANSRGVTTHELARLMLGLGAVQALNLDGGGSSTLWVRGQGEQGIVNHPSDNRRWDGGGERRVANALLVHARQILTIEADSAERPEGAGWKRREGPGGAVWFETDRPVRFALRLDRPGRYALEAVLPPVLGARRPKLRVLDGEGSALPLQPLTGGRWVVELEEAATLTVELSPRTTRRLAVAGVRAEELARPRSR